jgi:hypothetical protein
MQGDQSGSNSTGEVTWACALLSGGREPGLAGLQLPGRISLSVSPVPSCYGQKPDPQGLCDCLTQPAEPGAFPLAFSGLPGPALCLRRRSYLI